MTTTTTKNYKPTLKIFNNKDELSKSLATYIHTRAQKCLDKSKLFTVAVSGGSLPKLAGGYLSSVASSEYERWRVILVDERVVGWESEDCNGRLTYEEMCRKVGIGKENLKWIGEKGEGESVEDVARRYEEVVKEVCGREGVVDLVLLGIGPDGHTASLFPGHALLEEKEKIVAGIVDSPKPPPERVTLTLPVLKKAKSVAFVVTGDGKRDAVYEIMKNEECKLPARLVEADDLTWFLDEAAYGKCREAEK